VFRVVLKKKCLRVVSFRVRKINKVRVVYRVVSKKVRVRVVSCFEKRQHDSPLSYVSGRYLKIGPGKFHFSGSGNEKGFSVNHFFDGYATVAQFEIENGYQVKFQSKYLDTDVLKKANAAQKPVVGEFGTGAQSDPNKGWLSKCIPQIVSFGY
jgi:hypothetical protein